MTEQEVKELRDQLTLVRLDIRELNTKMDGIKEVTQKVAEVDKQVGLVADSSRAAHHRLDDMRDIELPGIREELREMRATQKWLIGILISTAVLALSGVGLLVKIKGG